MNIATVDWVILVISFIAFLALAIYLNRLCKSVADYLVSGRKVRVWLGMGAGIAGEVGLVSIVGMCEQGYLHGFAFVLLGLLSMLITVPLFGYLGFGIERFRASKAMTVPQYIEMRYSRNLRIFTGVLNSVAGVLQMSIFPIVGANFVRVLIHAPNMVILAGADIPTAWIIMALLLSCDVLFCFLGGFVTLVVGNFFHMIVTMIAIYGTLFFVGERIGLQHFWSTLESSKGLTAFYPFTGEKDSYGMSWFLWMMIMTILLQVSYGPYLQKYASMDKPKTVARSYLFGSLFGNGRTFMIIGLGVAALVSIGPHPPAGLHIGGTVWQTMATPYFLSGVVPPILMGVLLSGLLWADVSTTDQYIMSWSTSIVNDCICPFRKNPYSKREHIRAVRTTVVVVCLLFFLFGMSYTPTTSLWAYLWLCANVIGGTGIAVLFGMYWSRATTKGAYAAVLTCFVLPMADLVARRIYLWRFGGVSFPVKPQTTGLYTYLIAIMLLVIVSLLSREKSRYWDLGKTVRMLNRVSNPTEKSI